MNEEFLEQFRKLPDAKFAEKIHVRLERRERLQVVKRYAVFSTFTLIFVFGILMSFSSTVRAAVLQVIEEIAGLQFEVTSRYPRDPGEAVVELTPEYLSWEDASSRFLSPLQLPTYVPEGYERKEEVEFYVWGEGSPSVNITWEKQNVPIIFLEIKQCSSASQACGPIVGPGALEEITINGKPAVITRGGWNADIRKYDLSLGIVVLWRYDENTVYQIMSGDANLRDELIKMAESIP